MSSDRGDPPPGEPERRLGRDPGLGCQWARVLETPEDEAAVMLAQLSLPKKSLDRALPTAQVRRGDCASEKMQSGETGSLSEGLAGGDEKYVCVC